MALSKEQLLLLDNLIYLDGVENGMSVADIVSIARNKQIPALDGKNIADCPAHMGKDEWTNLLNSIDNDPVLRAYWVTNYTNDSTGMRAACFVDRENNPSDVNVVFRGTASDYEWRDNGQGAYLPETEQQQRAADYINAFPASYGNHMTVTGHSKGGNKAQYVTIVTDRVDRCLSFDGQGFSPEFLEKYATQIAQKSDRITSLSAKDDFVNCLLYSIAGTTIFIDNAEQKDFSHYHKPNIVFDDAFGLLSETERSELSNLIHEYSTYLVSNLDDPERSCMIDGLIAFLEEDGDREGGLYRYASLMTAASHADDFAFDYIAQHYGVGTEFLAALVAAAACPFLFLDDLLEAGKDVVVEVMEKVINKIIEIGTAIVEKLKEWGGQIKEFAGKVFQAIMKFVDGIKDWWNNNMNPGYIYARDNPTIRINTTMLRSFADELRNINGKLAGIDGRMDRLYWRLVNLEDVFGSIENLWRLFRADIVTGYSLRLTGCIDYINTAADAFEKAERAIRDSVIRP
jgi:hypothetical protein